LIDEIVRLFRQDHEIAQGVQFAVEHGNTAGLRADLDPDRMRQVVWNLLRNACQAQGRTGVVTIRTSARRAQGREESVSIAIEDQGTGLPGHVLDKIFEPFFTTKSDGTGLGLATSQRIVAEHGGTLRADNLSQGGARFLISLPMAGRSLAASDLMNSGDLPLEASLSAAPQGNP
jgi:signal transduction histidine kinase